MGVKDAESVADHTFRTALIALLLGDLKGLDGELLVRMALIHDLPEAVLGDKTPTEYRTASSKEQAETAQLLKLAELLPRAIQRKFVQTWRTLSRAQSVEAKLLKEIDGFEMLLQAAEYAEQGYPMSKLKEFFESARRKIHDRDLRGMADTIVERLGSGKPGN